MAKLYPTALDFTMKTRLSNSILIGEIFGASFDFCSRQSLQMVLFGLCADRLGRRWGIVGCIFFLVLGVTLATAAHGKSEIGMLWMTVIGRGVAGLGAGGEYAVCATSAVEAADETHDRLRKKRALFVASSTNTAIIAVFVASAIIFLIVLAAYGGEPYVGVWRICFGIGIIMPLSIFVFRMRMVDSSPTQNILSRVQNFLTVLRSNAIGSLCLGKPTLCSFVWFLYDAVVYLFNLFAPTIAARFSSSQSLLASNGWGALVNAFALPGAFFGGLIIDRVEPRQTYALGSVMVAMFGFVIGGAMEPLRNNDTGAIRKAGAAVGTQAFPLTEARFVTTLKGQQAIFLVGSGICVVGAIVVMTLVPNRRTQLEDEDVEFRKYLEENGWGT
ncbi:hypothetical protein I307_00648 [Cryptococcus deuterogattii 99/473]|uniref:Major facilitator superfamily (MFS) profile domain-containing protein n=1 Tax=Cryptococcus deuterogattii Ram5 TaxID=1296110 RepID=A0A0D0T710_9TREE|nr:hypothetical protein I309_02779 [Cryptococcus deuterogattii LA55]KIR41687.1 hypothetical protein I313_01844 [Cryptococcus deuterogattii Ram5]KIR91823.1 hypothetical protein I304_04650 [Cryptococcus deuterogattii CBS 10090]KIY60199.1 hypothetical protein I307_00648 [Cryptococcus deuterogattii 99/473]